MMSREEAISRIMGVWYRWDQETITTREEVHESEREMRECLMALGVTEAEINRTI